MSRRRAKRSYYWDGLQWTTTAIDATAVAFELINSTRQEFMPSTLVRIRGQIAVRSFHATTTGTLQMKIMYVEVNDAQTMTGDHAPIDTHEEDIAQRQLWTHSQFLAPLDELGPNYNTIEVDVKSKLRLESHGKKILVLLAQCGTANTCSIMGYLRCCTEIH